ncbi:hypothetical protein QR680_015291 [Steinernema hermaphroditum]|uniref:EGF-like domain-containing protein n=1 Tax=Steinernema hermaphroditum TaxID=289476 RepID=A0AA39LKL2_9BILA|nr:hypothetical protein QR680_015291 [Steinernema hermaphroditum]
MISNIIIFLVLLCTNSAIVQVLLKLTREQSMIIQYLLTTVLLVSFAAGDTNETTTVSPTLATSPPCSGCLNNGTCGQNGTCICPEWYEGDHCQTYNHPCATTDCGLGKCADLLGDAYCVCPKGYEGRNCEKTLNECSCQNGGQCVKFRAFPVCVCPQDQDGRPLFNGMRCENELPKPDNSWPVIPIASVTIVCGFAAILLITVATIGKLRKCWSRD